MGVPRGHTRALVVRTTMLLLLSTAAAWNLMPVDMRCTATLARAACAPAMTVGEESAPVVKLVQEPQSLGEDEAMRAWLAQQDDPSYEGSWTGGAAVVAPHVTPPSAAASTVPGAALSDAQIKEVTMETLDVLLEILHQMAVLPDGSSVASEGLQAASALAATKLQRELSVARAVAAADPGEIGSQDAFAPLLAEVHGIASEAPAAGAAPRLPPAFVATPAVSPAAPAEATASDAAAKAAWLARQPKPSWGRQVAAVAAECDKGDAEACDSLLNEDEARLRWLAQQDSPAWGQGGAAAAPAAASPVASAWQGSVMQGRVPVPGRVQASVQPVQGTWQGSVRGGQEAAEATRDLEATLPRAARTGNSEDAHPQAAPVQGSVRAWSVRGAAARKRLREGS